MTCFGWLLFSWERGVTVSLQRKTKMAEMSEHYLDIYLLLEFSCFPKETGL